MGHTFPFLCMYYNIFFWKIDILLTMCLVVDFFDWLVKVAQSCPTLCNPIDCSTPGSLSSTVSQSLLKFRSIKSVMLFDQLILCHSLLLLPSIFPISRLFSSESALCIRWPKCWSFSFSTSPSNEHSGLISFRTDRFDLLEVQGTLKSLLQHHSLKASILRCSAFFMVPVSIHDYWKNHCLD